MSTPLIISSIKQLPVACEKPRYIKKHSSVMYQLAQVYPYMVVPSYEFFTGHHKPMIVSTNVLLRNGGIVTHLPHIDSFNKLLSVNNLYGFGYYSEDNKRFYIAESFFSVVPCGHCDSCIYSKCNELAFRCQLELTQSCSCLFLTLTYQNSKLPALERDGYSTLEYRDFQLFMKRLRIQLDKMQHTNKIKYFVCGEYGGLTHRPHFHVLLFNLDLSFFRKSMYDYSGIERKLADFFIPLWGKSLQDYEWPSFGKKGKNINPETLLPYGFDCKLADSNASYYVSKYMLKLDEWSKKYRSEFSKPFVKFSLGLGRDYVVFARDYMRENTLLSLNYYDPSTGQIKPTMMCRYLLNIVYPSDSAIKCEKVWKDDNKRAKFPKDVYNTLLPVFPNLDLELSVSKYFRLMRDIVYFEEQIDNLLQPYYDQILYRDYDNDPLECLMFPIPESIKKSVREYYSKIHFHKLYLSMFRVPENYTDLKVARQKYQSKLKEHLFVIFTEIEECRSTIDTLFESRKYNIQKSKDALKYKDGWLDFTY